MHKMWYLVLGLLVICLAGCEIWQSTPPAPTLAPLPERIVDARAISALLEGLVPDHPRLVFRPRPDGQTRTFAKVRELFKANTTFRDYFQPILDRPDGECAAEVLAAKWICTGDDRFARLAIAKLLNDPMPTTGESGYYSRVWAAALAYDWLYNHPLMTAPARRRIEAKLALIIEAELRDLEDTGPAVWHGRNQYANNTLIAALSLSHHPRRQEYLRRAMAHYIDAVRALALVEAWPEGPPYWIYNRAVPYALAADCVRSALGTTEVAGFDLLKVLKPVAYWQLYMLLPDGRLVHHGDGGTPALRSGQPWQVSADYYARYTGEPTLFAAADLIRPGTGKRSYHPTGMGWMVVCAYDPEMSVPSDYDSDHPEQFLEAHLPTARLFGRQTTGIAYFRSSWAKASPTIISFKAGDLFAHHGHYDQGAFTIYKQAPLATFGGRYGDYFSPYRVGYYIQTVAVNSMLVLCPGEYGHWLRSHSQFDSLSGGQRVVMATGSDIDSVKHWQVNQNSGRYYEAADIIAYQSVPGDYDYVAADITAAYNSTRWTEPGNVAKLSEVVRYLVYLHELDCVVVFDRVRSTDPSYRKRWLLHLLEKPETEDERIIKGKADNGILGTTDSHLVTTVGEARLFHQILLPEKKRVYKIGGTDYASYVESDGDGSRWNGQNLSMTGREPEWRHALWRIEVEPAVPATEDIFLNVLWPRGAEVQQVPTASLAAGDVGSVPLRIEDEMLVFPRHADHREGQFTFDVPEGIERVRVFGAMPDVIYSVFAQGAASATLKATVEGVLSFSPPAGPAGSVTVQYQPHH